MVITGCPSFEECELRGASETALPVGTALGTNKC